MPPPLHREKTAAAARLGLAALLLVAGVILALGPGSGGRPRRAGSTRSRGRQPGTHAEGSRLAGGQVGGGGVSG